MNTAAEPENAVRIEREGYVALVVIDSPPVNAAGWAVRKGIEDAIETLDADPGVEVIALYAAGRTFIAGADIREFGKPPKDAVAARALQPDRGVRDAGDLGPARHGAGRRARGRARHACPCRAAGHAGRLPRGDAGHPARRRRHPARAAPDRASARRWT